MAIKGNHGDRELCHGKVGGHDDDDDGGGGDNDVVVDDVAGGPAKVERVIHFQVV